MRQFFASLIAALALAAPAQASSILLGSAYTGSSGDASLYSIDSTTGAPTLVGPIGFQAVGGIDFAPDGTLYGISAPGGPSLLITIDPSTGAGTRVGATGQAIRFDLSFRNANGVLFGSGVSNSNVGDFTIDTGTGVGALLSNDMGFFGPGNGMAFSAADVLYQASILSDPDGTLYTIDPSTGVASRLTALTYSGFPKPGDSQFLRINAMDFDPLTDTLYASVRLGAFGELGPNFLATVNLVTGDVLNIGQTVNGLDAIAFVPTSNVPEPASLLLLGTGLAGVVARRRMTRT